MHAYASSVPDATFASCYAFECWRHGFILPALFSLQDRVRAFSKAGRQQPVGRLYQFRLPLSTVIVALNLKHSGAPSRFWPFGATTASPIC